MNRYQWSTLNSIKTLFGYRNRPYQPVSQVEIEESKCSIDGNTSCMEEKISIENSKSSLVDHIDNVNMKQIDEILPLMNETSFNVKNILQPANSYTNDTRPDVDLLDC